MTQTEYKTLEENQKTILKELAQLKAKLAALGSLQRFEELTRKGQKFAKARRIKPADVLRGD